MAANFLKSLFGDEDLEQQDDYYENKQPAPRGKASNKVVSFNEANRASQTTSQFHFMSRECMPMLSKLLHNC